MSDSDSEVEFRDSFTDARAMIDQVNDHEEGLGLHLGTGARPKVQDHSSPRSESQNDITRELMTLLLRVNGNHSKIKKDFPSFDGCQNFNDYLQQILRIKSLNNWGNDEAANHLALALKGPALQLINALQKSRGDISLTWGELTGALQTSFSPVDDQFTLRSMLRQRRQQRFETLQQLHLSIICDVARAYPSDSVREQERLSVDLFCEAVVDPEIRLALLRKQPTSMAKALRCVEKERLLLQGARRTSPNISVEGNHVPVNMTRVDTKPLPGASPYHQHKQQP